MVKVGFSRVVGKGACSKKGFSLTEILVVMGILGILSGIAIVSYSGYKDRSYKDAVQTVLGDIERAFDTCKSFYYSDSDSSTWWDSCDTLSEIGYNLPSTSVEVTINGTGAIDPNATLSNATLCFQAKKKVSAGQTLGDGLTACVSFDKKSGNRSKKVIKEATNKHGECTAEGKCH